MESKQTTLVWALVTLAAAIIAGLFQLCAAHEGKIASSSQAIAEVQRLAEEERKKSAAAEAAAELLRMDNKIDARRATIAAMTPSFIHNGVEQFDRVTLQNDCTETIGIAVRYVSLDDTWVTEGWWSVAPHSSVKTNIKSHGETVYVYADTRFSGVPLAGSVSARVLLHRRFIRVGNEPLTGADADTVSFSPVPSGSGWGNLKKTFACS